MLICDGETLALRVTLKDDRACGNDFVWTGHVCDMKRVTGIQDNGGWHQVYGGFHQYRP